MRSLNSIELNALIFRNQEQNKTFNKIIDLLATNHKAIDLLVEQAKKELENPIYWPALGIDELLRVHDAHQLAL